jgi:hypothetical protein
MVRTYEVPELMKRPTIYEALWLKLGREPTNAELKAEVGRIKVEALIETAERGRLSHQKKRGSRRRSR